MISKDLALDRRVVTQTLTGFGLAEPATEFFETLFDFIIGQKKNFEGTILRFKRAPIEWDEEVAKDPNLIRQSLRDYLIRSVTQYMEYYRTEDAASIAVRIFEHLYLDNISDRALRTLFMGLTGGVSVTLRYLIAVEALEASGNPLPPAHSISTIYWKCVGDEGSSVIETVENISQRPEILSW